MEEEGIFYYFETENGTDILHISDNNASTKKIKTPLKIRKTATNADLTTDFVYNVSFTNSIGTNKINSFSYNEYKADVIGGTSSDSKDSIKIGEKEYYEQLFLEKALGDRISKTLLETDNSVIKKLSCYSYCPELYAGSRFEISGSITSAHNGEFFVISAKHTIDQIPEKRDTPIYYNSFVAIPNDVAFRPSQTHFKNRIFGCQMATVTGSSGEEIFCDESSRIKVKFHWDSRVQKDEKSSCWIRVAQSWAGNKFGGLIIPRIGMEVLVEFIDGNPDQPLVTGCLYNGVNKPPSDYANARNTVSTFYTNSSKGGEGFNELRFNDKKTEEEIFIHAQKDMNSVIENSVTETLNEGDYIVVLDKGNQSITLKEGNRTVTLSKGNLDIDVTGTISIKATKDITISSGAAININSTKATTVDSKDIIELKAVQDYKLSCMNYSAMAQLNFKVSALNAKIEPSVNLDVTATAVNVTANATLNVTANAAATIKSSAAMQVAGGAGLTLSGAVIKLN
jgi:type VI secretion system secreted protein VgrG